MLDIILLATCLIFLLWEIALTIKNNQRRQAQPPHNSLFVSEKEEDEIAVGMTSENITADNLNQKTEQDNLR